MKTYKERLKKYKEYNKQITLLAEDVAMVFDCDDDVAKQILAIYMEGKPEYEDSYEIPDFHDVCEFVRGALETQETYCEAA